jgi:pyruvate/2-oxoglutarate dehydrogenase complex dihydrolipoamide dehydrogenase (E3) component
VTGRVPATRDIGLAELGVEMDQSGYIVGNHGGDSERSSVPNIYAIGDVLQVFILIMVSTDRFKKYDEKTVIAFNPLQAVNC